MAFSGLRQAAAAAAVALLAGPAAGAEMMDGEALLETIPGATLSGISNEDLTTRWVQTYEVGSLSGGGSGTSSGQFGDREYVSHWSVRRDLWCENWGTGSGCWQLERVDEHTLQPYHGGRKLPNVWTILQPAAEQNGS